MHFQILHKYGNSNPIPQKKVKYMKLKGTSHPSKETTLSYFRIIVLTRVTYRKTEVLQNNTSKGNKQDIGALDMVLLKLSFNMKSIL